MKKPKFKLSKGFGKISKGGSIPKPKTFGNLIGGDKIPKLGGSLKKSGFSMKKPSGMKRPGIKVPKYSGHRF